MLDFLAVLFTVVFRTIAALFALAFIAAILVVLLLRSADASLFDARMYKRALSLNQVYTHIPALASDYVVSSSNTGLGPLDKTLRTMKPEDRVVLFETLLPPAETRRLAEGLIDQSMAYLNGESDTVALSLRELKANLAGPAGERLLLQMIRSQADCVRALHAKQEAPQGCDEFAAVVAAAIDELPADAKRQVLAADDMAGTLKRVAPKLIATAQADAVEALSSLPDEQVLIAPLAAGADDPREYLYAVRAWSKFALLVPLVLLLGVALFAVRSLRGWLAWWGVPCLIAGLAGVALGLSAPRLLDWAWVNWLVAEFPAAVPPAGLDLALGVARTLSSDLLSQFSFEAGLLAWAGLAAVILALVLPAEGGRSGTEALR